MMDNGSILPKCHSRWYDDDLYVSTMVYSMEQMTTSSRGLFAQLINLMTSEQIMSQGKERFLSTLNQNVLQGLIKARQKKRWYDQEQPLYEAFNKLFTLAPEGRSDLAHQLFVPCQLVEKYEQYCLAEKIEPDDEVIHNIVDTSLNRGAEVALGLYGLYLDYCSQSTPSQS